MTLEHPAYGQLRRVTDTASVLLCDNPGLLTLDGTNTWVLQGRGSDERVIVDPGPDDDAHIERIASLGKIPLVLISHKHGDHTDAIDKLVERTGAVVRAVGSGFLRGLGGPLTDGEVIDAAGLSIKVMATPGHTADSLSFLVDAPGERSDGKGGAVLTADTVLGRGTTVIDNEDGSLREYMESLRRLNGLGGRAVLPGHGPDLADLEAVTAMYIAHREERLAQVREALVTLGDDATRDSSSSTSTPTSTRSCGITRNGASKPNSTTSKRDFGAKTRRNRSLARSAGQPLGVADQHALALQADPTAVGEVGERLVDSLAGGADQLGDLLLRQVVRYAQRPTLLSAEPLGQLQQLLGHASWHVGEDQVGEVVVGAPQAAGQHAQ